MWFCLHVLVDLLGKALKTILAHIVHFFRQISTSSKYTKEFFNHMDRLMLHLRHVRVPVITS